MPEHILEQVADDVPEQVREQVPPKQVLEGFRKILGSLQTYDGV